MLNEKQIKSINLLISGDYTIQAIADSVGVHRTTIHKWRTENKEYMEEYQKRLLETTKAISQKFHERLDVAVDSLYDIITTPDIATRERKDACIYWINRVLGTPTNKTEILNDEKDSKIDKDDVLTALDNIDNDEDDKEYNDKIINIAK